MKKIIATLITAAAVLLSGLAIAPAASATHGDNRASVCTFREYKAIKKGMSRLQVNLILDHKGKRELVLTSSPAITRRTTAGSPTRSRRSRSTTARPASPARTSSPAASRSATARRTRRSAPITTAEATARAHGRRLATDRERPRTHDARSSQRAGIVPPLGFAWACSSRTTPALGSVRQRMALHWLPRQTRARIKSPGPSTDVTSATSTGVFGNCRGGHGPKQRRTRAVEGPATRRDLSHGPPAF